jgi:hypothetical protein
MGLAFNVVMVSKQEVNVTTEARVPDNTILFELAGLPETQDRLEVIVHLTLSLFNGLKV